MAAIAFGERINDYVCWAYLGTFSDWKSLRKVAEQDAAVQE